MNSRVIDSWGEIELQDLFYAFRKAKADCFFERSLFVSREFVEYELNLPENLENLLARLRRGEIGEVLHESLGQIRLSAKKLGAKSKDQSPSKGHGFFSDPQRAFRYLCDTHDLTPEFRLVGDFPVQMHVLSALWINLVGHRFDGVLPNSAFGSRLRRYRPTPGSPEGTLGTYHTEAIGSFQPYFGPYREWRERGLKAIRSELTADRAVIAITMDLTSYYHRIDPAFMADTKFYNYAGIELSTWEHDFTKAFSSALVSWSDLARNRLLIMGCNPEDVRVGGLPIGLSISRILSNALLVGLDREIEQQLSPVYYGRYVDDIFIVLRDPETVDGMPKLLEFMSARSKCFPDKAVGEENNEIWLKLPDGYQGKTTLLLQQSKQKIFFLQGHGGIDLLDSIESQIRSVSSERRLMPSPDNLESMAAAKVLTAAGQASEEADTLRRADGLSVRRLGWAVLLRAVETLARDLRQDDWKVERNQFYKFALNHILRPDKIFDHLDHLPRLLSLAVAMMDWSNARRLFEAAISSLEALQTAAESSAVRVNGFEASKDIPVEWVDVLQGVRQSAADAIIRSLRWGQRNGGPRPLPDIAINLCETVGLETTEYQLQNLSQSIRECDWAKISYKDHLRRDATRQRPSLEGEDALCSCYVHHADLTLFLERSASSQGLSTSRIHPRCTESDEGKIVGTSLLPYLFPTRPYTTQEVSLFLPDDCVFSDMNGDKQTPARNWARYVRAIRGVWVWDSLVTETPQIIEPSSDSPPILFKIADLDSNEKNQTIRLGISSLLTTEETWEFAAYGSIDLSRERYKRIERLVNQAVQAYPRPTHLLLPELSLPERWVDTVSGLLRNSGISLIAGLDYHSNKSKGLIHSEAVLVLADDRLGFPAYVQIHQPKTLPAPGEDQKLTKNFGKNWTTFPPHKHKKPVYLHKGFAFGVLVCSELQNVEHRLAFQGAIDCLMVISWNQDLETFSALVESASLDVHAHIALVNNREYGDSRVRSPAKANYARDLCRLRGGKNEHVVVVELDIKILREFQSRAKRWPEEYDPYKPVPEGFKIARYRKSIPS